MEIFFLSQKLLNRRSNNTPYMFRAIIVRTIQLNLFLLMFYFSLITFKAVFFYNRIGVARLLMTSHHQELHREWTQRLINPLLTVIYEYPGSLK
jgi:hypothetical protein